MPDVIVIGGGVIGLSIAWELAGQGLSVRVLEQGTFGSEASWAGAGMLPPGNLAGARTPEARLRGAAHQLWPDWSQSLTSATGIDNGYRRCGGIEARFTNSTGEIASLPAEIATLKSEGVVVQSESIAEIRDWTPTLGPEINGAYYLPDFAQVRNPRHVKALVAGCGMRGVDLVSGSPVQRISVSGEQIESVEANGVVHRAGQYIVAGGAWSGQLLQQVGIRYPIEPLKGQIVLLQANPLPFRSVIQVGREYLVPRGDGRILVGSTEERAGFDKRNTAVAVGELVQFAQRVVPSLKNAQFERCWAGLRPYSAIGKPYIGRLPQLANAYVAAGHFRYGLHLSPITAILIRQVLLNQPVLLTEDCLPAG